MLTVAQVAELCGVKPSTVRAWITRGKITRNRRGLISNADLMRWWDEERHAHKARLLAS